MKNDFSPGMWYVIFSLFMTVLIVRLLLVVVVKPEPIIQTGQKESKGGLRVEEVVTPTVEPAADEVSDPPATSVSSYAEADSTPVPPLDFQTVVLTIQVVTKDRNSREQVKKQLEMLCSTLKSVSSVEDVLPVEAHGIYVVDGKPYTTKLFAHDDVR